MYLVSCYFDEKSDERIHQYMKQIEKHTGNRYMLENKVPAHMTISAFDTSREEEVIFALEKIVMKSEKGSLQWASVGVFLPYVLFLAPVYNLYLHELMTETYEALRVIEGVQMRGCYQPYAWIPHTTIAKKLTKQEMTKAFEILQNSFGKFEGKITRIGLAKTNPYQDIISWELADNKT